MPDAARFRTGLQAPTGATDTVDTYDNLTQTAYDLLETIMALDSQGVFSARPTSTVGSPGKRGRYYFATDRKTLYRDNGTGWDTVGPRQSFATASLPGAFSVTSSDPAHELDTGMRCTLPAAAGDVIDVNLNLYAAGPSGNTTNIFAVHFLLLNDANAVIRGFPSRSGTFPPIFRNAGFAGSIDGTASTRLVTGDIRSDGTVRVSVGVHTGGAAAVVGTATQDRTISLKNLGQMG